MAAVAHPFNSPKLASYSFCLSSDLCEWSGDKMKLNVCVLLTISRGFCPVIILFWPNTIQTRMRRDTMSEYEMKKSELQNMQDVTYLLTGKQNTVFLVKESCTYLEHTSFCTI